MITKLTTSGGNFVKLELKHVKTEHQRGQNLA